jgi:hypothetical protein
MPRSQPSRADAALIAALAGQGLHVSPYQLERWRAVGLLPRNRRRGLGRGRGSVSELDGNAVAVATVLAHDARQGRRLVFGHVIERFALGLPAAEDQVRAAFAVELDNAIDRLAGDAPDTDEGWQQRYDAAMRVARHERLPVDGQALLEALYGHPARPEPPPGAERAAMRTLLQVSAGGEVAQEDLLQAMITAGYSPQADLASALTAHHASQLAGINTFDRAAAAMTITRLREVLQTASLTDLQRALAALYKAWMFQALVLLIGMARVGGLDQTRMPAWPHITPDTLRALQDDPVWWGWGRHLVGSALSRAGRPMVLVVAGLGLLMVPGMLAAVEGYRDRLERLAHAVDDGGLGQQMGSNRPAEKPKEARENRG